MATSTNYKFHLPCNDGTGNALDVSGQGNDASPYSANLTDAEMWANAGWITSKADQTDSGITMGTGVVDYDLNTNDSFYWAFWIKKATPGGTEKFGASNFRAAETGMSLWALATGGIYFNLQNGTIAQDSYARTDAPVCDGKARHVAIAVDGKTKRVYIFVDGEQTGDEEFATDCYPTSVSTTAGSREFSFGMSGDGGGGNISYDSQWRDIHFLQWDNAPLPVNVKDMAKFNMANPYVSFDESNINTTARSKNILAIVIGQSNERDFFPSVARPLLGGTAGASTVFEIGGGHGFKIGDSFHTQDSSNTPDTDSTAHTVTAFTEDTVTINFTTSAIVAGGNCYDPLKTINSETGCPSMGAFWPIIGDALYQAKNWWLQIIDSFSIGGASFITDYCGTTGSGDSRTVLTKDDVGWDPSSYLSNAYTGAENWSAAGFDELWFIYQHGQADQDPGSAPYTSTGATTDGIQAAYYQSAIENMIAYFAPLSPSRVYVGSSVAEVSVGNTNSYDNVIEVGIDGAVASTAAIKGPMMHSLLGLGYSHNTSDNHANEDGQRQMADAWVEYLPDIGSASSTGIISSIIS